MNLVLLFENDFLSETRVRITDRRKDHIIETCRKEKAQTVRVGKINENMGLGTITLLSDTCIEMEVVLNQPPPPPLDLTLIIALPRPKSLKKVLQSATSAGCKKILLIESWKVEKSFWSSPLLQPQNLDGEMFLGLEQAKDTIIPKVELRRRFRPFVEDELPAMIRGTIPLVAHPYNATVCPRNLPGPVTLAIGPEGGFTEFEIEMFKKVGFSAVSLGERILRVEYALSTLIGRLF